ncbi:hypothetical protein JTE90_024053 [Oedothorax gibbosus]|uniref:Fibronectin type-III domain-containing protein n=1 Tax=Oedothorax gibbosus TaxID=931172 RepID=A0AAV6VAJ7_9ARAC|nr:hypothetical protein JTE90_024053 [Oedothorax gibbosus]
MCVVFLLLLFAATARANPVGPCYKECDERLISDEEDFDVSCNETCKVAKCHDGCDRWRSAISTSCYEVCEEDKTVFKNKLSLYCIRGCNIAINLYMKAIESEVGTPVEPYLVAETRTNVSIAIQWAKSPYENISYLVQWRYDNMHHDWEYYKPTKLLKDHYLNVEGLHPYTKYRFRVAFILLENYPPIFSEESISISTLEYGAPSNAPSITCLTAVSATRISLTWAPPSLPNGPILSYVLYIQEIPLYSTMIKDITDTSDGLHYMFINLKPSTTYKIALKARNLMGESPMDERNITTLSKKEISSLHNSPAYLVYGSNHTVIRKGLKILDEKNTVFKIENDSISVTGVALHVRRNLFFVADSIGNVHSVDEFKVNTIRHSEKVFPTLLSMDWLNDKLFMAEEHEISRCDLNGKNYEIVLTDMKHRASDLHVDPINGYLYVTMADHNEGGLYRVDLSLLDSGESLDFKRTQLIVNDYYLTAFLVDYKNFRIILPRNNNTVISVALDGSDASDIRENSQTQRYKNITSIAGNQDRLYYSTGHQLFGEEYHVSENKYYENVFDNGKFHLSLHPWIIKHFKYVFVLQY